MGEYYILLIKVDILKKILFILIGLMMMVGLNAQVGLFELAYDMTLEEADGILALMGFLPEESEEDAVKYYSDLNQFVSAILVFVEPNTKRVAGWFVKYNSENGEDNDHLTISRIAQMHGKTNHFDEETQQLIWFLTDSRTLHVMYAADGSLTALYYNSLFPELFTMREKPGDEIKEDIIPESLQKK
ncbi:MAG TPA: hypothetical protein DHW79_11885 [Candidatus Cloacimonas sp.]|nr:hypothetical protein [Candidatus Cloacimonas sp.]